MKTFKLPDLPTPAKVIPYAVVGVVALGAAVWLWFAIKGANGAGRSLGGGAVDFVGGILSGANDALPEPFRPTSDQNLAYKGVNAVGGTLTGQKEFSLGSWVYDFTHPNEKLY